MRFSTLAVIACMPLVLAPAALAQLSISSSDRSISAEIFPLEDSAMSSALGVFDDIVLVEEELGGDEGNITFTEAGQNTAVSTFGVTGSMFAASDSVGSSASGGSAISELTVTFIVDELTPFTMDSTGMADDSGTILFGEAEVFAELVEVGGATLFTDFGGTVETGVLEPGETYEFSILLTAFNGADGFAEADYDFAFVVPEPVVLGAVVPVMLAVGRRRRSK